MRASVTFFVLTWLILLGRPDQVMAEVTQSSHPGFSGCGLQNGTLGAAFRGFGPTNAVEFTYFDVSKKVLGREVVLVSSTGSGSVLTPSLISRSLAADVHQVSCSSRNYQATDSLALDDVPCGLGGPVVDNGPTVKLKQVADFQSKVYLMLEVTIEKFFAQGTADLGGLKVFFKLDKAPLAAVAVSGLEPQAVIVGFADVALGSHDISYGILDYPDNTVMGHVCFKH
jgi:hypothetical protein